MAPEDILKSVDESRRDFLRKVIGGTVFAVPLMASFSMEGLSLGSADASLVSNIIISNTFFSNALCANQGPVPTCCEVAEEVAVIIGCLICVTGLLLLEIGASPTTKAQLFDPLSEALEEMSEGMGPANVKKGCQDHSSIHHYEKAGEALESFFEILVKLCGSTAAEQLASDFRFLGRAFQDLLSGDCESALSTVQGGKQRLRALRPSLP